jgi:HK97 family phage major capsid protein
MTDEVVKLVEGINKGMAEVKSRIDSVKGEISGELNAQLDKITADIEAKSKALDEVKAKNAQLEAAMSRQGAFAKQEKSGRTSEQKAALLDYLRKGSGAMEIKAMSTDVGSQGGFLVSPEMLDTMSRVALETSPIRPYATVRQTMSDRVTVIVDDQRHTVGWVGQGDSVSSTNTAQFGELQIPVHKGYAYPLATQESLEDPMFDIEAWLGESIARDLADLENGAFVSGDGVNKPKGFLSYSAWATNDTYERGKVEQIDISQSSVPSASGIIGLCGSLKEKYQRNAVWFMKRATYFAALKLKGNDQFHFGQTILRDGVGSFTLMGREVVFADDMPVNASNALSMAYGDFRRGYLIADRVGLTITRDNVTSPGNVKFFATKRVGGGVVDFDAIKIGKCAS